MRWAFHHTLALKAQLVADEHGEMYDTTIDDSTIPWPRNVPETMDRRKKADVKICTEHPLQDETSQCPLATDKFGKLQWF